MKKLLEHILSSITEKDNFQVEETKQDSVINYNILVNPEVIGLIIGKSGRTIKAIQNILRVKARLEKTSVFLNITEKSA